MSPDAKREDFWEQFDGVSAPDDQEPDRELPTESVRDLLEDELVADRIHGITASRRRGDTIYLVVSRSTTLDVVSDLDIEMPVVDLRTVVVDLEDDNLSVSDNGLWIPQEADIAETLIKTLARTMSDLKGSTDDDAPPLLNSAVDGLDVELLLDREIAVAEHEVGGQAVDKMQRHTGIDPARPWGYGAGPPPEIDRVVERLEEVGLNPAEHTTRLVWGKKEPMDRRPRPINELKGNYGIEFLPRNKGLIALDVDYPEHFPDSELPETFEVSSPHGDDSQRHIILYCDRKHEIADRLGAWAIQGVEWGDLWIGDRYVVGPGSQLSEYGCDNGEYERGEPGGCSECESETGGFYEIVNDVPIASVEPEEIFALIDESSGYELRDRPADPDPPDLDDVEDEISIESLKEHEDPDGVECDSCGDRRSEDDLKTFEVAGETRQICRGGCIDGESS